jgi:hypothetical protein
MGRKFDYQTLEALDAKICARISPEHKRVEFLKLRHRKGRPLDLDLMRVVTQVMQLKSELMNLVSNPPTLAECVAFTELM